MSTEIPIIPPDWYVSSYNAQALANDLPYRTALDPLLMMAWSFASRPVPFVMPSGV